MKRYRIVTNAEHVYRVQRRLRFPFARIWMFEKYYEVNDTYPKVIAHPVEFKTEEEAHAYIKKELRNVYEHQKWHVVKSFSDKKAS